MQWHSFHICVAFIIAVNISSAKLETSFYDDDNLDCELNYEWNSYEYFYCTSNIDCEEGWGGGVNSRCNTQTGNCECFDKHGEGRKGTILIDGVCYTEKRVGEKCIYNDECKGEGVICSGKCQCSVDYILWPETNTCLPKARKIGDFCKIDEQCELMGDLSVCLENSKQCGCSSEANHFQFKECYRRKQYFGNCTKDEECQASLGLNAKCDKLSYYRSLHLNENSKVCQIRKFIGEPCLHKDECEGEAVICSEICQCSANHILWSQTNTCLPKAHKIGDPCKIDEQCKLMGNLSVCLDKTRQCGCSSEAIYFNQNECLPKANKLGDPCKIDIQCQLMGNLSVCLENSKQCGCSSKAISFNQKECLPKARKIGDSCKVDEQCQPIGNLFVCLTDNKQCGCSSGAIHFENGGCYPRKQLYGTCTKDEECQASLGLNAQCGKVSHYLNFGPISSSKICHIKKLIGEPCIHKDECKADGAICFGACQCSVDYIFWPQENTCLSRAYKLGDPCKINEQCQSMGNLSICLENSKQCGCSSEAIQLEYEECFPRKQYNDTCISDEECQANLGVKVKCSYVSYYDSLGLDKYSKVCYCPDGKVCRSEDYFDASSQSSKKSAVLLVIYIILTVVNFIEKWKHLHI